MDVVLSRPSLLLHYARHCTLRRRPSFPSCTEIKVKCARANAPLCGAPGTLRTYTSQHALGDDPWGDTCTRRTDFGMGVAVSFVFFTFSRRLMQLLESHQASTRLEQAIFTDTLMQSFEIWKHYAYFTKTKG